MAVTQTVYNEVAPNNSSFPAALNVVGSNLVSIGFDSSSGRFAIYDGTSDDAKLYGWVYATHNGNGAGVVSGSALFVLGLQSGPSAYIYELDPTTGGSIPRSSALGSVAMPGGVSNGRLFTSTGNLNMSTWAFTTKTLAASGTPPIVVGSRVFGRSASMTLKEYTNDDSMTTVATYTTTSDFYIDAYAPAQRCVRDNVIWFPTTSAAVPLTGFDTATDTFITIGASPPLPDYSLRPVVLNPANGYLYQVSGNRSAIYVFDVDNGRTAIIDANDSYPLANNGVPYDGAMWFSSHVRI